MRNPFEDLGRTVEFDLVEESNLPCQQCPEVVTEGKYLIQQNTLTWKCSKGHISKIENWE